MGENCNSEEDTQVADALKVAIPMVDQGILYLHQQTCDTNYITWFGVKDNDRWNKVTSDYTKVLQTFQKGNVKHSCNPPGCNSNTYAYVYPDDLSHTIYLCGAFWRAPGEIHRVDSKPGTLVHEASHFTDIAGTDDIVYGTAGCEKLARERPDQAVKNADSHEYFVEHDPKCS